tara:strand:+ start:205 stop:510 length:306 start_codon:yes stop_codon:yes gene_type:complete
MDRINKEHLERLKDAITTETGFRHTLENMSGGWQLCRSMRVRNNNPRHTYINVDGAEKVFNWKGYMPKRELYDLMHAYLEGKQWKPSDSKKYTSNYAYIKE